MCPWTPPGSIHASQGCQKAPKTKANQIPDGNQCRSQRHDLPERGSGTYSCLILTFIWVQFCVILKFRDIVFDVFQLVHSTISQPAIRPAANKLAGEGNIQRLASQHTSQQTELGKQTPHHKNPTSRLEYCQQPKSPQLPKGPAAGAKP